MDIWEFLLDSLLIFSYSVHQSVPVWIFHFSYVVPRFTIEYNATYKHYRMPTSKLSPPNIISTTNALISLIQAIPLFLVAFILYETIPFIGGLWLIIYCGINESLRYIWEVLVQIAQMCTVLYYSLIYQQNVALYNMDMIAKQYYSNLISHYVFACIFLGYIDCTLYQYFIQFIRYCIIHMYPRGNNLVYNTVQYSTVHYSTIHYSLVPSGQWRRRKRRMKSPYEDPHSSQKGPWVKH